MKGIILAGGSGTRLYPITRGVSKQLLPVYDKPMIYYPLSVLMLANISDILIITTAEDNESFKKLLGDGSDFGIKLSYLIQEKPEGIAQAFLIGEDFIGKESVCLILGDNIFYGQGLIEKLQNARKKAELNNESTIFCYNVSDPERYGVAEFNDAGKVVSIEEKPLRPKSNYAVTGLYFYSNDVIEIAKNIKPSNRGELEITTVNEYYLKNKTLNVQLFSRGFAWLDTGTHDSLLEASSFIQTIEKRQGLKIACIEEIAYDMKFIDEIKLRELIVPLSKTGYGNYLLNKLNTK
ncbi:MAG: glucose-1-phosphate thymidylyltransferase RfbA [Bacteroidota bacterium]